MLNSIILMGRLTADPELRTTGTGTAVTTFSVAVDRDYQKSDAEKQTDFFNIVAWRGTAEFIARNFQKGKLIAVKGSLQSRKYTDREGSTRTATEIVADSVYFAGAKPEAPEKLNGVPDLPPPPAKEAAGGFDQIAWDDEDLPF